MKSTEVATSRRGSIRNCSQASCGRRFSHCGSAASRTATADFQSEEKSYDENLYKADTARTAGNRSCRRSAHLTSCEPERGRQKQFNPALQSQCSRGGAHRAPPAHRCHSLAREGNCC